MKLPLWCGKRDPGIWWFRVWGYGLHAKRVSKHGLTFSHRELGHGFRLFGWIFGTLTPGKW